ncbi:hypothetical protein [Candidatus Nitrosopumilus sediminis]|uniref:Uncharacterized protein n=1 Tax=Candidatus Nitrosopumilus sediminis TaxID=1229909 RepID=K0BA81_9ARCH|nr:hypothetical protein [Candidatus Nitrosopumilus sediminis]AFS83148.1 hypothetical protein NSED_06750 [Candidatus Nitrosopumilus sediminis]
MESKTYQVISEFDEQKDYGFSIRPRHKKCLTLLHNNQTLTPKDFLSKHLDDIGKKETPLKQKKDIFYQAMSIGKKIGVISDYSQYPIQFRDFSNLETVHYFTEQLRQDKRKNTKWDIHNLSPTQKSYLYALWNFSNWLYGKEFESNALIQTDLNEYKKIKSKTTLEGLEHFFTLYTNSHGSESDFIKMVKRYLYDKEKHGHKKANTIRIIRCAIEGYFEKNDSPIIFKFDEKARYNTTTSEEEEPQMSLEDVMKMLTIGRPTITQKAVILCKFHRGLDTSTFVDRFNFQVFEQLVEYFGTDQHPKWDLSLCPVPIKLTRIKTDYTHIGFLDVDAVQSIQDYLDSRFKKLGKVMQIGEPLFLNSQNLPISDYWIRQSFKRLANTSGIQQKLKRDGIMPKYQKDSHELRDLLKSTLIDCGTRFDITDQVIGHKPKDSYEKQSLLYPESVREEYSKASSKINIFSNLSSNLQKTANVQQLQNQVMSLQEEVKRLIQKDMIREQIVSIN